MRIRCIKPEFWDDEEIASWPVISRLVYIALWNEADDEGRLRCNHDYLKSKLLPYDKAIDMEEIIKPIINHGKLIEYSVNGQCYGYLPNFRLHQVINRPTASKLPGPNGEPSQNTQFNEDSRRTHGGLISSRARKKEGKGKEQGTRNKEGKGVKRDVHAALDAITIPESLSANADFLTVWNEWREYRFKLGKVKDWTALFSRQLKELEAWGPQAAIISLKYSMTNGYTGFWRQNNEQKRVIQANQGKPRIRENDPNGGF